MKQFSSGAIYSTNVTIFCVYIRELSLQRTNRITVYTKFRSLICLLCCHALYLMTSRQIKQVGWRSFQVYNRNVTPIQQHVSSIQKLLFLIGIVFFLKFQKRRLGN